MNPSVQVKFASLPYLSPLLNVTALNGPAAFELSKIGSTLQVRVSGSLSNSPLHAVNEFTSERCMSKRPLFELTWTAGTACSIPFPRDAALVSSRARAIFSIRNSIRWMLNATIWPNQLIHSLGCIWVKTFTGVSFLYAVAMPAITAHTDKLFRALWIILHTLLQTPLSWETTCFHANALCAWVIITYTSCVAMYGFQCPCLRRGTSTIITEIAAANSISS